MGRRKKGEGTWGEKTIHGTRYKYYRFTTEGKEKTFYGKTTKEIQIKIDEFKRQERLRQSYINVPAISFSNYILNWLNTVKSPRLKPSTFDTYENYIAAYISDFNEYNIGDEQMASINSHMFQEHINTLTKKYSKATINKTYMIIKQCLRYAYKNKDIDDDFTDMLVLPSEEVVKNKKKEIIFLSDEDMNKLYKESKRINVEGEHKRTDRLGTPFYGINAHLLVLIMYTGMRRGEMLALQWKDIDLKNNKLKVSHTASIIKNRNKTSELDDNYVRVVTSPKTKNSIRTIPLSKRAQEALKSLSANSPNHKANDFIATTKTGTYVTERNLRKTLISMLKNAECDAQKCDIHGLRHSFGSALIRQKVDVKIVSKLLGHKDVTTTYNIYIHILEEQEVEAIRVLDNIPNM